MDGWAVRLFRYNILATAEKCAKVIELVSLTVFLLNFVWKFFNAHMGMRFQVSGLRDEFTFDFYSSSPVHCGFPASP